MNQIIAAPLPGTQVDPRYPESDGRPVGETDYHFLGLTTLHDSLQDQFAARSDVYVGSNLNFYWKLGDPKSRRDPDVLVAKGVRGNHLRRSFRLWEEKKLPCTLFEISSRKTWR